jgi:hypothetical protein
MYNTGGTKDDLPVVLPLVDDGDKNVRGSMAHILRLYSSGAFGEETEPAVLKLLADKAPEVIDSSLAALDNCNLPENLIKRTLSLADDPEYKERVLLQVFRTMPDKPLAVVDRLIAAANDPNAAISGEAIAALRIGLSEDIGAHAAARLVDVAKNAQSPRARIESIKTIARFGGMVEYNSLLEMKDNPMLDDRSKRTVESAIVSMRTRLGI